MGKQPQYKIQWKDYYYILDIKAGCDDEKLIKRQRNVLIREIHPDKTQAKTDRYIRDINEAYEYLIDPESRALYWSYYQKNHPGYRERKEESERRAKEKAERRAKEEAERRAKEEAERRQREKEEDVKVAKTDNDFVRNWTSESASHKASVQRDARERQTRDTNTLIWETNERNAKTEARNRRGEWSRSARSIHRALYMEDAIVKGLRFVTFTPLSLLCKLIAIITKILGYISIAGFFYGGYCVYMVIKQQNEGVPLSEATHTLRAILFIALPFVLLLTHLLTDELGEYFEDNA